MNEVPVTGYITARILVTDTGIILVSSQGKKHAQKVRLYIRTHSEKERQEHGKQKKTDCVNFQVTYYSLSLNKMFPCVLQ